ncbi:hypothetical protein Lpar_0744 [Legionella parisiensis]|uniref:Uncharacterized protein n=1 Tax=Legionella parisiensis TaxID=45071 RepID=A0A1E5JRI1_9GAMM|nr:hypothetical protein Lpar_0744 [Legionella parisiensis]OEH47137.1 hypothetical protein lpari_01912 [Legionella parisiensis]STX71553.1 Uncharacterised protein [Legionella parisiensis]
MTINHNPHTEDSFANRIGDHCNKKCMLVRRRTIILTVFLITIRSNGALVGF